MSDESLSQIEVLRRQVQRLTRVSWAMATVLLGVGSLGFRAGGPLSAERFDVIDVQRINVRRPDGRLAVVIASTEKSPGNLVNGIQRPDGNRGNGLIFYDTDGNEAGGLIYHGSLTVSGRDTVVSAFGQLSMDRYESDQVAALRYLEDPREGWLAGLQVSHYPRHNVAEWLAGRDSIDRLPVSERDAALQRLRGRFFRERKWEIPRLFAGEQGQTATVQLRDMRGRERIRMSVDSAGTAALVFLDTTGKVVSRLPQ